MLLMALSACSNTTTPPNQPPLLVDSELGRPLANTQRSGDALLDRQRAQAQTAPQRQMHNITERARSGGAHAAAHCRAIRWAISR
jgi:general secretion pathway protein D